MPKLASLSLAVVLLAAPAPARSAVASGGTGSQAPLDTEVFNRLTNDIRTLSTNAPVWLAEHLPAMMDQAGLGAGLALDEDEWAFSIGLIPLRIGLLNQFSQVGRGTEMMDYEKKLPGLLPWPQFGVTAGLAFPIGLEVTAELQFIPEMDLNMADALSVKVGMVSVGLAVHWRINCAKGGLPSFILGVQGSYYTGSMEVGADHKRSYEYATTMDVQGQDVDGKMHGDYALSGAPYMGWDLYQIGPELKIAWKAGPVQPYFGFGFGYASGRVYGGARLTARASATFTASSGGYSESTTEDIVKEDRSRHVEVTPDLYVMRPFLGLELRFGVFSIGLQVDYALVSQDPLRTNYDELGGSFASDGGSYLYNKASKRSTLHEALVGSLSVRLVF